MFCVYFTFYLGDKLPPYYIGSSSVKKVLNGYHGTVTSIKWKKDWEDELKQTRALQEDQYKEWDENVKRGQIPQYKGKYDY